MEKVKLDGEFTNSTFNNLSIAMSNERLYNFDVVEGVAMKPSKLKWSIKISAIVKIVLNKEDRRMLTIFTQLPKIKQQISLHDKRTK